MTTESPITFQWFVDNEPLGLNIPLPTKYQLDAPNSIELVTYDSNSNTEQHRARSSNLDIRYRGGWDVSGSLNLNERNELESYMFEAGFLVLQTKIIAQAMQNSKDLLPFVSVFLILKLFFFASTDTFITPYFTKFVDANIDPITVAGAILAYMPVITLAFLLPVGSFMEKVLLVMSEQIKGVYVGAGGFVLYAMTLNEYHSLSAYVLLFILITGCHFIEHSMLVMNKFGARRARINMLILLFVIALIAAVIIGSTS